MSLANTVARLSRPASVTRKTTLVFADDGRPDGAQTDTTVELRLSIQPKPGTQLVRLDAGDEAAGEIVIHVTTSALSAVSWTSLQVATPPDSDGPPGDIVTFGRGFYEVTRGGEWALEGFSGPSNFQRYEGTLRGAA